MLKKPMVLYYLQYSQSIKQLSNISGDHLNLLIFMSTFCLDILDSNLLISRLKYSEVWDFKCGAWVPYVFLVSTVLAVFIWDKYIYHGISLRKLWQTSVRKKENTEASIVLILSHTYIKPIYVHWNILFFYYWNTKGFCNALSRLFASIPAWISQYINWPTAIAQNEGSVLNGIKIPSDNKCHYFHLLIGRASFTLLETVNSP